MGARQERGQRPRWPRELVEMEGLINFELTEPPGIRSPQGNVWADEYQSLFAKELETRGLELVSLNSTKWGIFYVIRKRGEEKCWLAHSTGPFRKREVIHPVHENGTSWIQGRAYETITHKER